MENHEMIERLESAATTLAKDESDFIREGKTTSAAQAADALKDVGRVRDALKEQLGTSGHAREKIEGIVRETVYPGLAEELLGKLIPVLAEEREAPSSLFMAYGDAGDEGPEPIGLFVERTDADRALKKVEPLFVSTNYWPFIPDASYEVWLRETCEDRFGEDLNGLLRHPEDYPNAHPTEEWKRIMKQDGH